MLRTSDNLYKIPTRTYSCYCEVLCYCGCNQVLVLLTVFVERYRKCAIKLSNLIEINVIETFIALDLPFIKWTLR